MPSIGASVTYIPWGFQTVWMLCEVLFGGASAREGVRNISKVVEDAKRATTERLLQGEEGKKRQDMLTKLLEIVDTKGKEINFSRLDVSTEIWAVIWAGADTTAIALTAIFYFVHKHPAVLARLKKEIDDAFASGTLSNPIRYSDAMKLQYLPAVIRESMRCHPSLGLGLPRIVPAGGAEICGQWIPGGTTVVINQNVVHFDQAVFGEDAADFNPERWLDLDPAQLSNMARHDLSFGYGSRVCVGKYVTMLEMYKLLPVLLREFDFEFERSASEWRVTHSWFQQPADVKVRVALRTFDR